MYYYTNHKWETVREAVWEINPSIEEFNAFVDVACSESRDANCVIWFDILIN